MKLRLTRTVSIFLALIGLCAMSTNAQEIEFGTYYWKTPIVMEETDLSGTRTANEIDSKRGQKFYVIKNIPIGVVDYSIIRVLEYDEKKSSNNYMAFNMETSGAAPEQRYFLVTAKLIEDHAVKYERTGKSLAFGVINYPFKFRPQKGKTDFGGGFNLGAALGMRFQSYSYRKFSWTILSGYSISSITLDQVAVSKNKADLSETNNFSAFTFSLGLMTEYEKIQAGFFVGWDNLSKINQERFDWDYAGRPWVSIGFGYSIFSSENAKKPSGKDKNKKS